MLDVTCFVLPIAIAVVAFIVMAVSATTHRVGGNEAVSASSASRLSIVIAVLMLLLAIVCVFWIWADIPMVYWGLFHFYDLLLVSLIISMLGAIFGSVEAFRRQHLTRSALAGTRLIRNGSFLAASVFFWLAILPLGLNSRTEVDDLTIQSQTYHLVSSTNGLEQHSRLELYQCDSSSILCRSVAQSNPDHCAPVTGKLNYDASTNVIKAEAVSCFQYTAFAFCAQQPCTLPEK